MEHRLKILPAYIEPVVSGRKSFEVRKDDRRPPFRPGDTLVLEEFAEGSRYTGRWVQADVDLVLRGEYCKDGYCIMSITPTQWHGFAPPTNAERIRGMTDEDMARDRVYSATFEDGQVLWYGDFEGYCIAEELAVKLESMWLSQPAEEN